MTPRGEMSGGNQRPPLSDLPPGMKSMFDARPPVQHPTHAVSVRKMPAYSGMATYAQAFETVPAPARALVETPIDRAARVKAEHLRSEADKLALLITDYDPKHNLKATESAFQTLFVGRLAYETTERKLRREFEQYGPIRQVVVVSQQTRVPGASKPRGYAFIEFEKEDDVKEAYKRADGKKIDDRRIVVDVERGRTVRGWLPRRLGGGLGGRKDKRVIPGGARSINNSAAGGMSSRSSAAPSSSATSSAAAPRSGSGLGYGDRDRDRDRDPDKDRDRDRDRVAVSSSSRGGDSRYGPSGGGSSADSGADSRKRRSRERDAEPRPSSSSGSAGKSSKRSRSRSPVRRR